MASPTVLYLDSQYAAQNRLSSWASTTSERKTTSPILQNKVTEAQDKVTSIEKKLLVKCEIRQAEQAYQAARNQSLRVSAHRRQSEIFWLSNKRNENRQQLKVSWFGLRKQQEQNVIKSPVTGTIYSVKATRTSQAGEKNYSARKARAFARSQSSQPRYWIRQGMRAKVKMATFPFQEFGFD